MPIDKTDLSFKKLINRQFSSPTRNFYQEFGTNTLEIDSGMIYTDEVSPSTASAIASGKVRSIQCVLTKDYSGTVTTSSFYVISGSGYTADVTNSNADFTLRGASFFTLSSSYVQRNFLSEKYGSEYTVKLRDISGNQLSTDSAINWYFDYKTGIVHIANPNSGTLPYSITASQYIGRMLSSTVLNGNVTASNISASGFVSASKVVINGTLVNGSSNVASGVNSHAEGESTTAEGNYSHAEGQSTSATGFHSHAEGWGVVASGANSHAEGFAVISPGAYSHAEGFRTSASGAYSHAEGKGNVFDSTTAFGNYSHAEGEITLAFGESSHAEGYNTTASGTGSHAEGSQTKTFGNYSHAEGKETITQELAAHAEGWGAEASWPASHAEGYYTKTLADYSHAEGYQSTAKGLASHVEGQGTFSSGQQSHAEGFYTSASGESSHAEGEHTRTFSTASHSEGTASFASASYSHAEGMFTTASGVGQHVSGKYNVTSSNTNDLFIIGNGTSAARSNILVVNTSSVTIGEYSGINKHASLRVKNGLNDNNTYHLAQFLTSVSGSNLNDTQLNSTHHSSTPFIIAGTGSTDLNMAIALGGTRRAVLHTQPTAELNFHNFDDNSKSLSASVMAGIGAYASSATLGARGGNLAFYTVQANASNTQGKDTAMVLTSVGLGIAVDAPSERLTVNGNITASGNVSASTVRAVTSVTSPIGFFTNLTASNISASGTASLNVIEISASSNILYKIGKGSAIYPSLYTGELVIASVVGGGIDFPLVISQSRVGVAATAPLSNYFRATSGLSTMYIAEEKGLFVNGTIISNDSFQISASSKITSAGGTYGIGTNTITSEYTSNGYKAAFYDYFVSSGSNIRSGNITSCWSGSTINYFETVTVDIGNTDQVTMSVILQTPLGPSPQVVLLRSNSTITGDWTVKAIARYI